MRDLFIRSFLYKGLDHIMKNKSLLRECKFKLKNGEYRVGFRQNINMKLLKCSLRLTKVTSDLREHLNNWEIRHMAVCGANQISSSLQSLTDIYCLCSFFLT